MSERLKNTLSFVNLGSGASVVLPHGLSTGSTGPHPLAPDVIFIPSPDLAVVASDDVAVTLMNQGAESFSGSILVEAWHTIERAFGGVQNTDLPVKPYVIVSAESNDQPPQPPFNPNTIIIYARTTGSDVTGDGTSPATAYRTLQRAVRDVPNIIAAGVTYIVDITGITEALPAGYTLPAWKTPFNVDFYVDSTDFLFKSSIMIQADLQPVVFVNHADGVINASDVLSDTSDPITGLRTIVLNSGRASWVGLAGKMVRAAFTLTGDQFFTAVIYDNPNTATISITQTATQYPYTISEPGATLTGGLNAMNIDSIGFAGLRIGGLFLTGPGAFVAENCELNDAVLDGNAAISRVVRNWLRSSFENLGGSANLFNTFVDGCDLSFLGTAPGMLNLRSSVFLGCTPIETHVVGAGLLQPAPTSFLHLNNSLVRDGQDDGVRFWGSKGRIANTDIFGCVGNGVFASDPGLIELLKVGTSGAPNGLAGVRVDNAAQVRVNVATSTTLPGLAKGLTGTSGDMLVGAGLSRGWSDFVSGGSGRPAFNELDITAIAGMGGTLSDQAPAPAYATGTVSRLFQ